VIRGLVGLNIVYVNPHPKIDGPADWAISGADVVEVSPPYDHGASHPSMSYGLSLMQFGSHLAEITTIAAAEMARDFIYLLRGDNKPPMPPTPPDQSAGMGCHGDRGSFKFSY
jgi:hypothetical protein